MRRQEKPWRLLLLPIFSVLFLQIACATVSQPRVVNSPGERTISPTLQDAPNYVLKRRVVIARFTNETTYGKSVLVDGGSLIERQASDILHTRLAEAEKFILFEHADSERVLQALAQGKVHTLGLPAEYLIVGSVTEFGREMTGETGVFSRTKTQRAHARVSVRLVDVRTSHIMFASEGSGEAISEVGTVLGVGTHAGYDSSLNDKAISAAISKLVSNLVENLLEKPWRSYVLSVEQTPEATYVMIGGGKAQGLAIGHRLAVLERGRTVNNPQTNMPIELPATRVATIQVVSMFGDSPESEGSKCRIVAGMLSDNDFNKYVVEEEKM